MNISPDSCIVITPSHLRRHVCDFKMHNVSLKNSAKLATVPGLDDPAQSYVSCFLLPSPILHELEKKLRETTALLCLVLVQAKQSIPSCWLEQLFAQLFDMSLDCQKPTFIYSHYRFRMRKLTSPRLDERMKVSSPWLEANENDEVNFLFTSRETPFLTSELAVPKVILKSVPWIKPLPKVWWSAHPLVQDNMLPKRLHIV